MRKLKYQRVQLKALSEKEKFTYLELAFRMNNIQCDHDIIRKIIKIYDLMLLKGGNVDIHDLVVINNEEGSE